MKRSEAFGAFSALGLPFIVGELAFADDAMEPAASDSAASVVAREVERYNAHDAAAVTASHAADASLTLLPSGKVLASGSDALLAFFSKGFRDAPNVKLTLLKQVTFRSVVVNHYSVTGGAFAEILSIYDVKDGFIVNEFVFLG